MRSDHRSYSKIEIEDQRQRARMENKGCGQQQLSVEPHAASEWRVADRRCLARERLAATELCTGVDRRAAGKRWAVGDQRAVGEQRTVRGLHAVGKECALCDTSTAGERTAFTASETRNRRTVRREMGYDSSSKTMEQGDKRTSKQIVR